MRGITLNNFQTEVYNLILKVLPLSFDVSYEMINDQLTYTVYGAPDTENLQRSLLATIIFSRGDNNKYGLVASFVYASEVEQDTILKSLKKQSDYPVHEG